MSVPIRVRHPRGVTTLEVDTDTTTVDELKVLIFSATEIPPSRQEVKYGYPPKPLPNDEGPLSNVPISRGEQLIITAAASSPEPAVVYPRPQPHVKSLNETLSAPPASTMGEKSVKLPGDAGVLVLRVVPDDNSCLFSSIGIVFEGGQQAAQKLREVVANEIRRDPIEWSDVILGQSRQKYVQKIADKDTWGGAIELSIFSRHYKTEVCSFDVATGRCDRFGEGEYENRCVLIYSGIHYDAVTLSPMEEAPASFHTSIFPVTDITILPAAEKLVAQLKAEHYYTDTANFDLRCAICSVGLKGETGAREHAMQTGHVEFGEY